MGATLLVTIPLDEGAMLVEEMDKSGFPFVAAFWLYHSEYDKWKLRIATPVYDDKGPREAYSKIQAVFSQLPESRSIDTTDITAVGTTDEVVTALRTQFLVRPGDPVKRVRQTRIDNVRIDEAFIYRLI